MLFWRIGTFGSSPRLRDCLTFLREAPHPRTRGHNRRETCRGLLWARAGERTLRKRACSARDRIPTHELKNGSLLYFPRMHPKGAPTGTQRPIFRAWTFDREGKLTSEGGSSIGATSAHAAFSRDALRILRSTDRPPRDCPSSGRRRRRAQVQAGAEPGSTNTGESCTTRKKFWLHEQKPPVPMGENCGSTASRDTQRARVTFPPPTRCGLSCYRHWHAPRFAGTRARAVVS